MADALTIDTLHLTVHALHCRSDFKSVGIIFQTPNKGVWRGDLTNTTSDEVL